MMNDKSGGDTYGSAHWMTGDEAQAFGLKNGRGLYFGITRDQSYLQYDGDGHSLIVAPPGAGKGVGFVVPNLMTYRGSMIVIDPKGENAAQTARHRCEQFKQDVYVLDPSGVSGLPSASYNPLSWLDHSSQDNFMADLIEFSEAIVEGAQGKEAYWTNCAQNLFRALVLYLAGHHPDKLNLNEVYRLSRLPEDEFSALIDEMATSECQVPQMRGWIREQGSWFQGQTPEHKKYHLSTMQPPTNWMVNPGAQQIMETSDFDFRNIKRRPMTVYLCIHPMELNAYRGWFRILISQAIKGVFEPIGKPAMPVVFMLDEYARAVGRLSAIDNAIPQIRGYGGRFAFVLQSLGQAKELFKEGWTSFEESCGLRIFIEARGDTAEHVSKRLGVATVPVVGVGGLSQTGRPLKFSNEVSGIRREEVIAFVEGEPPLRLKRITSYEDPKFRSGLDKSNMERQAASERSRPLMAEVRAAPAPPISAKPKTLRSGSKADRLVEAYCAFLSVKHDGRDVYKKDNDVYGYDDEMGMFVPVD